MEDLFNNSNPEGEEEGYNEEEEREIEEIIRDEEFDYKSESEKIQTQNLIYSLVNYLKNKNWYPDQIVDFLENFFSKRNLNNVWFNFSDKIIEWAGLD